MSAETHPKWFGLHVPDFLDDPRMMHLSAKEKGQWALLLIMMFRCGAVLPDDIEAISNMVGIRKNEARQFREKLIKYRLLCMDEIAGVHVLVSNRLAKEYEKACSLVQKKIEAGIASGAARRKKIDELENEHVFNTCSNIRSTIAELE